MKLPDKVVIPASVKFGLSMEARLKKDLEFLAPGVKTQLCVSDSQRYR